MTTKNGAQRGEVLVAIMNNKRDFAILQEQHWYRVPVDTAPRRWPPRWLAFYQTKVFDDERWAVNYYGRVRDIRIRRGQELGLYEPPDPKASRRYYQVRLESIWIGSPSRFSAGAGGASSLFPRPGPSSPARSRSTTCSTRVPWKIACGLSSNA